MRHVLVVALALLLATYQPPQTSVNLHAAEPPTKSPSLADLCTAFRDYSGATLVFRAEDLPPGQYHDRMPPLDAAGQLKAAEVALAEVKKLPKGYLKAIGLKSA